uniref:Uncharacterized protein n=1 Tax=Romanomermis culicivorax TaxID=13658 RepID=A0A915K3R0_ROMCU
MTDLNVATKKPAKTKTVSPSDPSGAKTPSPAGGKQPDVMAILQKMYKNRLLADAKKSDSKPPPTNEPDVCVTFSSLKRRAKQPQQPIVAPTSAATLLKSGTAAPPEPPPTPSVPASPAASGYHKNIVGADSGGGSDALKQQNVDPTVEPAVAARPKPWTSKLIVRCNIIIVTLFLFALFAGILIWFIIFIASKAIVHRFFAFLQKRRRNDSFIGTTTSQTITAPPYVRVPAPVDEQLLLSALQPRAAMRLLSGCVCKKNKLRRNLTEKYGKKITNEIEKLKIDNDQFKNNSKVVKLLKIFYLSEASPWTTTAGNVQRKRPLRRQRRRRRASPKHNVRSLDICGSTRSGGNAEFKLSKTILNYCIWSNQQDDIA